MAASYARIATGPSTHSPREVGGYRLPARPHGLIVARLACPISIQVWLSADADLYRQDVPSVTAPPPPCLPRLSLRWAPRPTAFWPPALDRPFVTHGDVSRYDACPNTLTSPPAFPLCCRRAHAEV